MNTMPESMRVTGIESAIGGVASTRRHPVGSSVAACAVLAGVLITVAFALPLPGNVDHAAGHLALAIPLLLLLAWALLRWPRPGPERAARLARGALLLGLATAGLGLAVEAVGAFGYSADGLSEGNDLVVFHAIGVPMWPVGFVALMAGSVISAGVGLARRLGAGNSRLVTGSAVLAVVAAVGFVAGSFIFGY